MKSYLKLSIALFAAGLLTFSLGCQPPQPPAPSTSSAAGSGDKADAGSDNMTSNTTASSETPGGETP